MGSVSVTSSVIKIMSDFLENQSAIASEIWPDAAHLYDQFPNSFHNAIRTIQQIGVQPLTAETQIKEFSIYYGDVARCPAVRIQNGKLTGYSEKAYTQPADNQCTSIRINGDWAYIQVGTHFLLERLGDANLPKMPTIQQLQAFESQQQQAFSVA